MNWSHFTDLHQAIYLHIVM